MKIVRISEMTEFPEWRELTEEERRIALDLARAAFTAEDLQKYTELDEGVPMEDVLAELEEIEKNQERERS